MLQGDSLAQILLLLRQLVNRETGFEPFVFITRFQKLKEKFNAIKSHFPNDNVRFIENYVKSKDSLNNQTEKEILSALHLILERKKQTDILKILQGNTIVQKIQTDLPIKQESEKDKNTNVPWQSPNISKKTLVEMANIPRIRVSRTKAITNRQRWQFSQLFLDNGHWEVHGGQETSYKSIMLLRDSEIVYPEEYRKLEDILRQCGGYYRNLKDVYALQNDALENSFVFQNNSLIEKCRSDPQIFKKKRLEI